MNTVSLNIHIPVRQSDDITSRKFRGAFHLRIPERIEMIGTPSVVRRHGLEFIVKKAIDHPIKFDKIAS